MENSQLEYVLEELDFSADLPAEVLTVLASDAEVEQVSAGTVIFREGGQNSNLFLVNRGRIALEMNVPGRETTRILTVGPGEMVGWSALLGHGKMTATAIAVEESELVVLPTSKLSELSDANREFGYHLMKRMAGALSKRLVATRLQLLDLFADNSNSSPNELSEGNG